MNDGVLGLQARVSTQASPIKWKVSSVLKSAPTYVMQTLNVNKVVFKTVITQCLGNTWRGRPASPPPHLLLPSLWHVLLLWRRSFLRDTLQWRTLLCGAKATISRLSKRGIVIGWQLGNRDLIELKQKAAINLKEIKGQINTLNLLKQGE